MFSVYILYSQKLDKFYIGYTSNFKNRIEYHNNVEFNKIWSKRGIPWKKYLLIEYLTQTQAIAIESHIKKMKSKKYIYNLAKYPSMIEKLKEKYL